MHISSLFPSQVLNYSKRLWKIKRITEAENKESKPLLTSFEIRVAPNMIKIFNISRAVFRLLMEPTMTSGRFKTGLWLRLRKIMCQEDTIHTFGYDADHNSEIFNAIYDLKNGIV
jgi:hypothetical protein